MSGFQLGAFRPVETPDLGATLSRMAAIDAQRQQTALARQAFEQDQGFNRTLAAAAPGLASGQGPEYDSALASIAAAGPRGLTLALPLLQQSRDRREAAEFWRQGSGATPAAMPAMPVSGGAGGFSENGLAINTRSEGGGDPNATNPRSTATGANQFIDGTWLQFAGENPQLFQGMSREQILAARTNPQLSAQATQWYARRNSAALSQAGVPVNDATLGLAHQFDGPVAARIATAPPNTPIDQIVGPAAMAANPDLVGQTAGQVVQRFVQRYGGGAPASAPQAGGVNPAELALLERALQSGNPQIVQQAQRRMELLRLRMAQDAATRREQPAAPAGYRWAADGRSLERIPGGPRDPNEQTGPFAGNGMDAQANNVALRLAGKIRAGTATPEEQALYQRAYAHLAGGVINYVVDPSDPTGLRQVAVRVPRDMGDLPAPGGGAAPGQAAPQQGMTTPTQGMTTPTQAGGTADATPMPTAPNAIPGMERMSPPPAGFRRREDGSMEPIPGGPQDHTRTPLTEAQGRSNMFGNAMQQAESILGSVNVPNGAAIAAWRSAPEILVNPALSANDQQYFNALRLFAAGVLRKETGAAFTSQELLDVQSRFFPMPGDSPQVLAQKARARQQTIASMQAEIPGGFRGALPQSPGPGGVGTAEPPARESGRTRLRFDAQGNQIP